MQTLGAVCSKVEPRIFTPLQTPFPRAQDGQNLISWRWSLPSSTDPVWWRSMHAVLSYHGNRPTNKPTDRQDRLQYTASYLVCSVIITDKLIVSSRPTFTHWMAANRLKLNAKKTELLWAGSRFSTEAQLGSKGQSV